MRLTCLLVTACCLAGAGFADERDVAREHFQKGSKAFDLGLYDKAIDEYMAAYEAKDDPALLYNIAQAHRLAGHSSDALRFYRVYLNKVPQASNRSEVQVKIAELQKLVDQERRAKNLPPDHPLRPTKGEAAATGAAPGQAAPTSGADLTTPAPKPAAKRAWVWGVVAGGVVAVGLAVGLGVGLSGAKDPGASLGALKVN